MRYERINVQTSCFHGVFKDGSRRWVLTHQLPITLHGEQVQGSRVVETHFGARRELTLREAAWEIAGQRISGNEVKWWELKRVQQPSFASIGERFRNLVEWHDPSETAGVCDLCAIEVARRGA